jgi:HD-GYP domain-containing protein (c-di-GMP phosphodiesterase class II)
MLAVSWIYWYGLTFEPLFIVAVIAFGCLIFMGDAFPISIDSRSTVGVWDVGMIVAVAALGPTWAAVAVLPSAVYVGRKDWLRTTYETSHNLIIVYLAGIVFSFSSTPLLEGDTSSTTAQVVYGTLAASLALICANKAIMATLLRIKYGRSMAETWREDFQPYVLSDVVNMVTAGLGVLALIIYGPVAAVVVVAGSIGSQVLVYRSREQMKQIGELRAKVESLEAALTNSNTALGTMMIEDLGRKDGYTDRHAAATAVYAADMGCEMKLDETHVGWLRMAGLLHNIGLFSMPDELLLATGKLNSIAQARLVEHPVRGEEALAAIPEFGEMASWIRWHHERVDGRGYPDKLRDPWIPLEAKILAVVQAYAAMILDKPHRAGMEPEMARRELVSAIGTQFDATLVRTFLRILDTDSEGYRRADDHRFAFPSPGANKETIESTRNIDLKIVQGNLRGEARQ